MKLFYYFLFFVCASLILLACANIFASDPQKQAQTDEFTSPEPDAKSPADDTVVAVTETNPFMLTSLKQAVSVQLSPCFEFERNYAFKTHSYLYQFQMAINQLGSPQKFK